MENSEDPLHDTILQKQCFQSDFFSFAATQTNALKN